MRVARRPSRHCKLTESANGAGDAVDDAGDAVDDAVDAVDDARL